MKRKEMLTRYEIRQRYLARKKGEWVPPVKLGPPFGIKKSPEQIQNMSGPNNPNWKGGVRLSKRKNGPTYREIRVPNNHHLAHKSGYAYEHRVLAENKLGRSLLASEIVHHDDKNGLSNSPENLIVTEDQKTHLSYHPKKKRDNPIVFCLCGCGKSFRMYDEASRKRRFVSGHNPKGKGGKFQMEINKYEEDGDEHFHGINQNTAV